MPETEKLLDCNRPEGYVFHWGLGTLSHCGTALAPTAEEVVASDGAADEGLAAAVGSDRAAAVRGADGQEAAVSRRGVGLQEER